MFSIQEHIIHFLILILLVTESIPTLRFTVPFLNSFNSSWFNINIIYLVSFMKQLLFIAHNERPPLSRQKMTSELRAIIDCSEEFWSFMAMMDSPRRLFVFSFYTLRLFVQIVCTNYTSSWQGTAFFFCIKYISFGLGTGWLLVQSLE